MKTIAISSFFVLFALAAGIVATTPAAFADHSEVTIETTSGSGTPGCEETAEGCYIPNTATVDVGGKVIMSNTDNAAHTFTAETLNEDGATWFDSGLVSPGASYEWTPTSTGDRPYFCIVHPWMIGSIIVQEVEAEDDHGDEHGDGDHDKDGMSGSSMGSGDMTQEGDHGTSIDDIDVMDDMNDPSMKTTTMLHDADATGMLSDGTMVSIWASEPTAGERMEISVEFRDSEHVNLDMLVMQNGEEVLHDKGAHRHDGMGVHETAPLSSSDPVDITVTFTGYGVDDPKTGPIGEEVVFSNVVPEFGTIAMMILAVAIISIIAVTAKSRVIPRF